MGGLLDRINSPADIRDFSVEQLRELCAEVRKYMVDSCAVNPGHLGSSLGAVELIVGLHYVFDTPADKIVFDVSHQAYAHKILTGRREAFQKNRRSDGISGFTRRDESPYDAFGAGHSSTSISAALGFAEAARIKGSREKAIALIGDGALTGGMAFEALNNAGASKANLLVILNDNNQSIDAPRGGLHNHLLRITTSLRYNRLKECIWKSLGESRFRKLVQLIVRHTKSVAVEHSGGDLFEALGMRYFGPIDGNSIQQVVSTLKALRNIDGPIVLHTLTTKGKGYSPAELDPVTWHAPGKFDPATGRRETSPHTADRYQDVFGQTLCELAADNPSIVGITPAMASGSGMVPFSKQFPSRFYDVGIEEEHAVTFSAGLAAGGLVPFCNIYSSFAQRSFDQIVHDVALQRLPVVLCFDRAGLVGEDGATHHGAFDMASLRCIPDCIISVPSDESELRQLMYSASIHPTGPYIIRYPRGCGEGHQWRGCRFCEIGVGSAVKMCSSSSEILVLAIGPVVWRAVEAASAYSADGEGQATSRSDRSATVWNVRFLKPFPQEVRDEILSGRYRRIITAEDGAIHGGLFSAVSEIVSAGGADCTVIPLGIPDRFIHQGRQTDQRAECGLTAEAIGAAIADTDII